MQYIGFLSLLISYGDKIRQHWPLILAFAQAGKALYDSLSTQPVEGSLQLTVATDDELNAEERLAVLLDGNAPSVSLPGRFRQVFQVLDSLGVIDRLKAMLAAKIGS